MLLKFSGCLVWLFFAMQISGQNYSNDVELLETKSNTVVVRSAGIHENKKEAQSMAVKSAFYTYFTIGIKGLNNDKPLMGGGIEQPRFRDYLKRFFDEGRYNNFVRSVLPIGEAERLKGIGYKVTVKLEFLNEALYRDLLLNQVVEKTADKMSLEESQEQMTLPTIMVVPFSENSEKCYHLLQEDFDLRTAIDAVSQGFIEKGVRTIDFLSRYKAVRQKELLEQNAAVSTDKLVMSSYGADVKVEVDIQKFAKGDMNRVALNMVAKDAATDERLATAAGGQVRFFKTSAVDQLCRYAVLDARDEFLKQIATEFAKKTKTGATVTLDVSIDASCTDLTLETEIGDMEMPLSVIIRNKVRKFMSKGHKPHSAYTEELSMSIDQIILSLKDEEGALLTVDDFAEAMRVFLKEKNIDSSVKVMGNKVFLSVKGYLN